MAAHLGAGAPSKKRRRPDSDEFEESEKSSRIRTSHNARIRAGGSETQCPLDRESSQQVVPQKARFDSSHSITPDLQISRDDKCSIRQRMSTEVLSLGDSESDETSSDSDSSGSGTDADTDTDSSEAEEDKNANETAGVSGADHSVREAQHVSPHDSGHASEPSPPPANTRTKSGPQKLWAVRVGWIPGIYDNYAKASAQTFRYPRNEIMRFEDAEAANRRLSDSSWKKAEDSKSRPKSTGLINQDQWTRYVQRTWDKKNSVQGINEKEEIVPKLKYLFERAHDALEFGLEVEWDTQPLPQKLIQEGRSRLNRGCPPSTGSGLYIPALRPLPPITTTRTEIIPTKPTLKICNCDNADLTTEQKEVTCANPGCKVGRYHAICVGLAKRTSGLNWRCRDCRPPLPPLAPRIDSASSRATPGPTEPPLSAQQASVVDLIVNGANNVCYTGSAGTGKSTVLKAAVNARKKQGKKVDIVAPSGIAALAVNGQTTFTYAGWTPDTFKTSLNGIGKRARGKKIRRRLCKTDVLIIEEISMVDSDVLQRLDRSCREARDAENWDKEITGSPFRPYDKNLPFGGMQVIVTGDFCQLPPVKPFKFCLYCGGAELPGWKNNHGAPLTCPKCNRTYEDNDKWAFQNEA